MVRKLLGVVTRSAVSIIFIVALVFLLMKGRPPASQSAPHGAEHGHDAAEMERRAGIETEPVVARELLREIRTVGKIDYNEPRVADITARIAGRVDRLRADFTGVSVKQGDHLVEIYSPDLLIAQRELIASVEALERETLPIGPARTFNEASMEAARTKLLLWGILPQQVDEIVKSRKVRTHLTLYATQSGIVIEKRVREGQYVKEGDLLYRIADLDPIWLYLEIYESDLAWVRFGQKVQASIEAYPGRTFPGTVVFIDPYLNDATRTVKVRVNLNNSDRLLKPAMYTTATIRVRLLSDGSPEPTGLEGKWICPMHPEVVADVAGKCTICGMTLEQVPPTGSPHVHGTVPPAGARPTDKVLAVRSTAVLDTGIRRIVYRRKGDGFEPVDVVLGHPAEGFDDTKRRTDYLPVLKGLSAGDEVAVRGGFLIDSQRQIDGLSSLLYPQGRMGSVGHAGHAGAKSPPKTHNH